MVYFADHFHQKPAMTRTYYAPSDKAAAGGAAVAPPAAKFVFLPGCTPDGYVKSPAMGAYFQAKLPPAHVNSVYLGSVCVKRGFLEKRWFANVLFEDGRQYHYELQPEKNGITLTNRSTRSERIAAYRRGDDLDLGDGYVEPCGLTPISKPGGVYRLQLNKGRVVGYVHETFALSERFDDKVKALLNCAALAVADAVHGHRLLTQAEAMGPLAQ
jgi:hypothetical protein